MNNAPEKAAETDTVPGQEVKMPGGAPVVRILAMLTEDGARTRQLIMPPPLWLPNGPRDPEKQKRAQELLERMRKSRRDQLSVPPADPASSLGPPTPKPQLSSPATTVEDGDAGEVAKTDGGGAVKPGDSDTGPKPQQKGYARELREKKARKMRGGK